MNDIWQRRLPHEQPLEYCECTYSQCGNTIYRGERNWEFYGDWFCSALCIAKHLGAERRFIKL